MAKKLVKSATIPDAPVPLDWLEEPKVVGADVPVDAVDVFDPANESPGWLAAPQVTIGQDADLTGVLRARRSRAHLDSADPLARKIKQKAVGEPTPAPFVQSPKSRRTRTRKSKSVPDVHPKFHPKVRLVAREVGPHHVKKFCARLDAEGVLSPAKWPEKNWLELYANPARRNAIRGIKLRFSPKLA